MKIKQGACVHEREMHYHIQITLTLVVNTQFSSWYAKIIEENTNSPYKYPSGYKGAFKFI